MKSEPLGRWIAAWDRLRRAWKTVVTRVWMGMAILALASVIYLEPYCTGALSCSGSIVQALAVGMPVEWKCFGDVLGDLRKDGAAAGVILAIAAAVLASAWSSGSDTDAVE